MRSIIKSGLGNGRTVFFASDEWRGEESNQSQNHHRLEEPQKLIDHTEPSATRSAAKNEYGGSFFGVAYG